MAEVKTDEAVPAASEVDTARANLKHRCEQVATELEDRLQQLATLVTQIDGDAIDARAAEARLRQLSPERTSSVGPLRAGRTTIGLSTPARDPQGASVARTGPMNAAVEASLARAQQLVCQRLAAVLMSPRVGQSLDEARIELGLLNHLHDATKKQAEAMPRDPVLLAAVGDQATDTQATLAGLETGGSDRVRVLANYVRGLQSQLAALNADTRTARKPQPRSLMALEKPDNPQAVRELVSAYQAVTRDLNQKYPVSGSTLFDELARR